MRTTGGFLMSSARKIFDKPALSLEGQLEKMIERGVLVTDRSFALEQLRVIGYYRLSGYGRPFQVNPNVDHSFIEGTKFEDIIDAYNFDRDLRRLVFEAIEVIEIATRAAISNYMSEKHGPHWYLNRGLFRTAYNYYDLMALINNECWYKKPSGEMVPSSKHVFIKHYLETYKEPELPPSWMLMEALTLSTWSTIFANIEAADHKKAISASFGVHYIVLESWLHSISYIRNVCAHHGRLWNKILTIKPMVLKALEDKFDERQKFYKVAFAIKYLMDRFAPEVKWQRRILSLVQRYPNVPIDRMGFPENWHLEPMWGLSTPAASGNP